MNDFRGKVAFITGAASGIGLGIARACAAAGMKVVMADIRESVLNAAAAELSALGGGTVRPIGLDVTDRNAWATTINRISREIGEVDLLCSNAGVNFVGPAHQATYEDWDFALGVNVGGAINAVRTVVPRMIARNQGGHVVITSSVSGLFTGGGAAVYVTSKYALVGLGESLRADLKPHNIGVSVLCPGPVQSELFESTAEVRPQRLSASGAIPIVQENVARDTTPIFTTAPTGAEIGQRVLKGVRENSLYIMTHPEIRPVLESRAAALLGSLPDESVNPARIAASARLLDASLYQLKT